MSVWWAGRGRGLIIWQSWRRRRDESPKKQRGERKRQKGERGERGEKELEPEKEKMQALLSPILLIERAKIAAMSRQH